MLSNVAVIGMGPWGRRLIRALDELGVLAMVCNRGDSEHQAWVRDAYPDVRVGQSATEAFADPQVDAVVIATPIRTHAQMAVDALAAGKHCFVEKPLATTAADAWRVVEAADRADRRLAVGHVFMFDPGLDRLHEATAADPVVRAAFSWSKFGTFGEPLVWNLLPHELGLALWFMAEPDTIEVVERSGGRTELDHLRLRLGFAEPDRECSIEIDRLSSDRSKTATIATRSGAIYTWRDGTLSLDRGTGTSTRIEVAPEEPLIREMRAFLDGGRPDSDGRSDGRFGARVAEQVERVEGLLQTTTEIGAWVAQ